MSGYPGKEPKPNANLMVETLIQKPGSGKAQKQPKLCAFFRRAAACYFRRSSMCFTSTAGLQGLVRTKLPPASRAS